MEDNQEHNQYFTKEEEEDEIWENIFKVTRSYDNKRKKQKIFLLSTAAIVIGFVGIIGYLNFKTEKYIAGKNYLHIVLSDNTKITLFPGSSLSVENFLWKNSRNVYLNGNAVFNVSKSKNHPFIVQSKGYETKVLGTVFKIIQNNATFNVDLYEGKVQITNTKKTKDVFVLHPKETFSNMGTTKVATIVPTKHSDRSSNNTTATLSFDNAELTEVVHVLQKTFGIKIKYPLELGNQKISITKEKTTAKDMIGLISYQFDLTIKNNDDKTFELEN